MAVLMVCIKMAVRKQALAPDKTVEKPAGAKKPGEL